MNKTGFGALLCGALMACGGAGHKSTLPPVRNVQMPAEDFAVQAPPKPFEYDMAEDVIEGDLYLPDAGDDVFMARLPPATPLPKGKAGKDLKARRAAFAKAKTGKDKVKQAEWLTEALVQAAKAGDLALDDAIKEAHAALEAAVADPAAGEVTWQMAATMRSKDPKAAAEAWQKLVEAYPNSPHLDDYKIQLSRVHFGAGPDGRKQAAADLAGVKSPSWWVSYVQAWAKLDQGNYGGETLKLLEDAAKAAPASAQRHVRADWLHTLGWSGLKATDLLALLASEPLADIITVANYEADKGDLESAAALFAKVLKDPAVTPEQIDHAYEVRTQEALAGRRLADLAGEVEELLGRADKFPAGDDAERAAQVSALIATTIHAEWSTTHEDAAAQAAKRMYAAVLAHPALSTKVNVKKNARDLDEQMAAKDVPAAEPDKQLIRRVVRLNWNGLRHCYELSLARQPDLHGSLAATLKPGPDGVNQVTEATPTNLGADDGACMKQSMEAWRFPPHSKRADITVKVSFKFVTPSP